MKFMLRPSTATGTAAHFLLGIAGGTVALWAGGTWLLGLATIAAGHVADALDRLGTYISGAAAILVALVVFLGGVMVLVGTPMWGAAFVVRGVEGLFQRARQAGRP
jgi:hypothetical protein